MSPWERQLQYLFEQAQEGEAHEESSARLHLTMSANGSVYTAVVPPSGHHIHLHAMSVYNPGNTTAVVRLYVAGATGPSNIIMTMAVPAAVDSRIDAIDFGIKLPDSTALAIGTAAAQAGSLPEAIIYYHLEDD
jgi:hypothetical protein